jgi:hypothetical protein
MADMESLSILRMNPADAGAGGSAAGKHLRLPEGFRPVKPRDRHAILRLWAALIFIDTKKPIA